MPPVLRLVPANIGGNAATPGAIRSACERNYPTMTVRHNITFGMESRRVPKPEQDAAVVAGFEPDAAPSEGESVAWSTRARPAGSTLRPSG